MKNLIYLVLLFLISSGCSRTLSFPTTGDVYRLDPRIDQIIEPGALPEILARGFNWSEGPLWLPSQEKLIFSDIPENSIFEWSETGGLKLYLKPSGYTGYSPRGGETGSNGLLLDPEGRLVLCQHGDRRMARMNAPLDHPRADFITLADQWNGKRFNSPNDAVYSREGCLYFTDPAYGLEQGFEDTLREIDFTGVYKLETGGGLSLITDTLSAPNGIGLSPDGSTLYVANSGRSTGLVWMTFKVDTAQAVTGGRLFYDAGVAADSLKGAPDGMDIRSDGIIFATGPGGVWIFHPDGTLLGIIKTGQATSNCTFDETESYLYMTADMYLMRIPLKTGIPN